MAIFSLELTPNQTLENIETLEQSYGLNDSLFRCIHHWGSRRGQSGSLIEHVKYLKGKHSEVPSRYKNKKSSNYIVAQRIEYIISRIKTKEQLGELIAKAKEEYPFFD